MAVTIGIVLLACVCTIQCAWVKEMENPGVFQGDMVLDPDEKEGIWKTHSFASIKGGRWPGGRIPYQIESSIGDKGRRAIAAAIATFHSRTCLRFHRRTNERAFISFFRGGGCSSPVGYRSGRMNRISLASGCWYTGTVIHEIGHSIGIYHEQSRPDRDSHVRILWNNIQRGMSFNFDKQSSSSINSLGTPYDFRSVMHYGQTAFGNGRRTIQTINPRNQNLIGQRQTLSSIDVIQINRMYCNGVVPPTKRVTSPPVVCKDNNQWCNWWMRRGECRINPGYMKVNCKKSCRVC